MSGSETGGVGRREVAWRLFAAEFDDATLEYSDSDEERAPNYVVTPTGARVNRVLAIGVLTEIESVSDDVLRARIVDPTGAFVVYAGQYQPDAATFLERAEPPMYVSVTGKARTFTPDGSDRVFTSIRPESVTEVDADTRDRWTVQAAGHTIDRIAALAVALDRDERGDALTAVLEAAGLDPGLAAGIPVAIEHYGTTPTYLAALRRTAVEALEVVTGDRDEVTPPDASPDEAGAVDATLDRPTGELVARGVLDRIASVEVPSTESSDSEDAAPAESGGTAPTDEPPADPVEAEAADPTESDETAAATDEVTSGDAPRTSTQAATDEDEPTDDDVPGEDAKAADDVADASAGDDELYELDDDEREQLEAEYGTEFSAGSEVDAPGEAGIEPEATADTSPPAAGDAIDDDAAASDDADGTAPTDDGDVDLEAAVVDAMRDLDDGDGVDHDAVVETVAAEYDADEAAVADAIQDALMSGKCYEPGDDRLKAI